MATQIQHGALNGKAVLVVEDQYLIAHDIARTVRSLGGDVIGPTGNLEQARTLIKEHSIDLVLLDVNLNGESALPLVHELERRMIRYILATGYDEWVMPPGIQTSVRIEKPITIFGLTEAVARLDQIGRSS